MQKVDCDYSEIGGAEAVEIAQPPQQSPEQRILGLLRTELSAEAAMEVFSEIEYLADDLSIEMAASAVRQILLRLGNSAAGVALRCAVLGPESNYRDAAAQAGVSHVAILRQAQRIRAKLETDVTKAA